MDELELVRVFGLGALGGSLVELLRWWKIRDADRFPAYARKGGYWVITALMICAGGALATLYGLDHGNAAALINIGASTPAIIGALAARPPEGVVDTRVPEHVDLGQESFSGRTKGRFHMRESVRRFIAFSG